MTLAIIAVIMMTLEPGTDSKERAGILAYSSINQAGYIMIGLLAPYSDQIPDHFSILSITPL